MQESNYPFIAVTDLHGSIRAAGIINCGGNGRNFCELERAGSLQ